MLYNIREKENNSSGSILNHKIDKYMALAKQFLLKLDYPLILFTDDEELSQNIKKERDHLKEKTRIYNKKFEDTYFYKYKDRLEQLQKHYHILNGHLEHETPLYIILNNNKFDFMENAIQLNPFNSSHFIWMDFGINHVALNTEKIHEWINLVPDKIKQLCINPYVENVQNKEMFQYIYHHTAGGLFTGSKENMLKYAEMFKAKTEEIYQDDWYQIDEAVMTMVQRDNPELFDLFYGDYQGIISNYLSPINNIHLILNASQKYINVNNTRKAYEILNYCSEYFKNNINDESVYNYILQHIIVDYYVNNKRIVNSVIDLINSLKIMNDKRLLFLLSANKNNINYYENKDKI